MCVGLDKCERLSCSVLHFAREQIMTGLEVFMPGPLSYSDNRYDNQTEPESPRRYRESSGGSSTNLKVALVVVAVSALLGMLFAGISTSDFVEHLDRNVHSTHCSFLPGAAAEVGDNGCRTVMMSPYSSLFRSSMWGGIPIAVLALATYAYMLMRALTLLTSDVTKRHTLFQVVAWALPVLMSVIYAVIAINEIGAVCKLCVGVYASSAVGFIAAIVAHKMAEPDDDANSAMGLYGRWFGEGVLYVVVMTAMYVLFVPQSDKTAQGCGTLVKKDDPGNVFIPMTTKGTPALVVLDPLCPACKGFDERLQVSGLDRELAISTVLFPLDSTCNWMVKESMHPGACAVSEAMLCDVPGAADIMAWAFEHQERLRTTAKTDEAKVRAEIEQKFPKVKGCLGSPKAKNQVNKSLRFAVSNALPVTTPQLFIQDKRVCDEDTDLGLEFAVDQMLHGQKTQGRGGKR
jgi:uncharacterized membrane protein